MSSRSCEICGGSTVAPLHRQRFTLPGGDTLEYRVVACEACGFVFAGDIPSPAEYERYYAGNSRYTYEGSRNVPRGLYAVHEASFHCVDSWLAANRPSVDRTKLAVVDVGCSTGHLLSFFAKAGWSNVRGVDPAAECRTLARELYGVEVETAPLSGYHRDGFEVMLLSSVLEHVPDLADAVRHLARLLVPGAIVMVQVPDAESFGANMREPFLEFSVEHINYFTRASLANLMEGAGFSERLTRQDLLENQGTTFPAITSTWEKTGVSREWRADPSGKPAVARYVERSTAAQRGLETRIDELVNAGERIAIWGTGSLTARLLATTRLPDAKIETFVDSNPALHGKALSGIPIVAPSSLAGKKLPVLIASYVYAEEIRRTLLDMHYEGRVVTLP